MSVDNAVAIGKAVVVVGALLELRHLVSAILKHFAGCQGIRSAMSRAVQMDDATIVGTVVCAILAVGIVVTILGEFGDVFGR